MTTISSLPFIEAGPYQGYSYTYPHKTAYRPLRPAVSLADLWQKESQEALFCYVHIPFCEMRCGFCNLLTTALPEPALVDEYLGSLERQTTMVRSVLSNPRFSQFAIGGGTPTYLSVTQLQRLLRILHDIGVNPEDIPGSVETSPATATPDRLNLLKEAGVARISIGIQTFCEKESKKLGRQQPEYLVDKALQTIASNQFPCVNIDLMYGGAGQTLPSWRKTVQRAIEGEPQEIYIYPLYVRPVTGLWKTNRDWNDMRIAAYREARDLLKDHGFTQISMRMFRRDTTNSISEPEYCCQRDGMIGLGCGARSYTRSLHYATEYAVGRTGVREIIARYISTSDVEFTQAANGIRLNREEQIRRFVIKSLLRVPGIDCNLYEDTFDTQLMSDLPILEKLLESNYAVLQNGLLSLTADGLEMSDAIGPWLYSDPVQRLSKEHNWR